MLRLEVRIEAIRISVKLLSIYRRSRPLPVFSVNEATWSAGPFHLILWIASENRIGPVRYKIVPRCTAERKRERERDGGREYAVSRAQRFHAVEEALTDNSRVIANDRMRILRS